MRGYIIDAWNVAEVVNASVGISSVHSHLSPATGDIRARNIARSDGTLNKPLPSHGYHTHAVPPHDFDSPFTMQASVHDHLAAVGSGVLDVRCISILSKVGGSQSRSLHSRYVTASICVNRRLRVWGCNVSLYRPH
jgi:hypothetical protein